MVSNDQKYSTARQYRLSDLLELYARLQRLCSVRHQIPAYLRRGFQVAEQATHLAEFWVIRKVPEATRLLSQSLSPMPTVMFGPGVVTGCRSGTTFFPQSVMLHVTAALIIFQIMPRLKTHLFSASRSAGRAHSLS